MRTWVLTNVLFLLLSGCNALHVPQSEVLLFERGSNEKEKSTGFTVQSGIVSRDLKPYAVAEHLNDAARDAIAKRNFYGASFTSAFAGKAGVFGIAIGSGGVGFDYSFSISQKVYVTAYGNVARNFGGFIQLPIYRKAKSGLGVGVFYRNERHGLLENCRREEASYWCLGHAIKSFFRVSAIGLRIAQYFDDDKGRLRLRFSVGYSPELKGLVIIGGLQAGKPKRRK